MLMTEITGGVGNIGATPDSMTLSAISEITATIDLVRTPTVLAEDGMAVSTTRLGVIIVILIVTVDSEVVATTTPIPIEAMADPTIGIVHPGGFTQARQGGIATGIARAKMRRPHKYRGE